MPAAHLGRAQLLFGPQNPSIIEVGKDHQDHQVQAVPNAHFIPSPEHEVPCPGLPETPSGMETNLLWATRSNACQPSP